jgi:hypothetical protein
MSPVQSALLYSDISRVRGGGGGGEGGGGGLRIVGMTLFTIVLSIKHKRLVDIF